MRRVIQNLLFSLAFFLVASCSERQQIGGGYLLVTPPATGPDNHPGTSLKLKDMVVWNNIYIGYFSPHDANRFFHEGMLVFVGPLPGKIDWWSYPQLFAVRGGVTPVVLSERLLGKRLVVSTDSREMSKFAVSQIMPVEQGVRVVFDYWADANSKVSKTNDLAWEDIKHLLDEADVSAKFIHHSFGDYRILPIQ